MTLPVEGVSQVWNGVATDNGEEESYTKLIDMFSENQFDHNLQHEQREIIDINGMPSSKCSQ